MSFSLLTMTVISENLKQTFTALSLSSCSDFSFSSNSQSRNHSFTSSQLIIATNQELENVSWSASSQHKPCTVRQEI